MGKLRGRAIALPTGTLSIPSSDKALSIQYIILNYFPLRTGRKAGQDMKNHEFKGMTEQTKPMTTQKKKEIEKYTSSVCDCFSYIVPEEVEKLKGAFRKLTGLRR